ncbi:cyclic-phosphate processing receiver domain-containing protein [Priestia aryabhattai]
MDKKRSVNLYLDDKRDCPSGFVIARTVDEAIRYLENYDVHILSLDHDLGEDAEGELLKTGYDLVKYICANGLRANKIYIHTSNPVGREDMYKTLLSAQKRGFIDSDIQIRYYSITIDKYSNE